MRPAFQVKIHPRFYLTPCPKLIEEQQRGLFGFHRPNCPDCVHEQVGFEFWGENGHKQGGQTENEAPDPQELAERYHRASRYSSQYAFSFGPAISYMKP